MSDTVASLRRQITRAGDLRSVVRTMKTLAASSIGQYEKSVRALADYARAVELGLGACIREIDPLSATEESVEREEQGGTGEIGAVVFGSDQGLVGQFNDAVADYAIKTLTALPGEHSVWAVGERVHARLADSGLSPRGLFAVPSSIAGIAPLVGQIQVESEAQRGANEYAGYYVFHNRPQTGAVFEPAGRRLLPLDQAWLRRMANVRWPTQNRPEVICGGTATLRMFIREHLFVTLFQACAESLASENASRLAAMERADKNIEDLLEILQATFHRLRQNGIDEELFDVIAGFEALSSDQQF